MASEISNNGDEHRYEIRVDGELAGFAVYRERPGLIAFIHTEIDDRFGGRGLGTELIAFALGDVAERDLEVLPFCSFVSDHISKHPDRLELVPADQRERFGL